MKTKIRKTKAPHFGGKRKVLGPQNVE